LNSGLNSGLNAGLNAGLNSALNASLTNGFNGVFGGASGWPTGFAGTDVAFTNGPNVTSGVAALPPKPSDHTGWIWVQPPAGGFDAFNTIQNRFGWINNTLNAIDLIAIPYGMAVANAKMVTHTSDATRVVITDTSAVGGLQYDLLV